MADKQATAATLAGLVGIRIGHLFYAGKIDDERTKKARELFGTDFMVLTDAFELLISHRSKPTGVEVNIIPTWIPPFDSAVREFTTRVDSFMDLTSVSDQGFHGMVRSMIGGSGVLVPGATPLPNLIGGRTR